MLIVLQIVQFSKLKIKKNLKKWALILDRLKVIYQHNKYGRNIEVDKRIIYIFVLQVCGEINEY